MSSRAHTTALVQAAAEASGTAGHLEALVVAVHAVRARRAELAFPATDAFPRRPEAGQLRAADPVPACSFPCRLSELVAKAKEARPATPLETYHRNETH